MDFVDRIRQLADRVGRQKELCLTEEAAKTAFVLPFFQALGYDVFNPLEVQPEFVSDVGTKKGEKVDYAISLSGEVCLLVECKPIGARLEVEHANQLFRYFSVTSARFGVLTDGVKYCFYTDLDATNKMDSRPFFVLDLSDYKDSDLAHLKKFSKEAFDVEAIISTASDMKYQRSLAEELSKEFEEPSEEFTRLMAARVYSGRFTQGVSEKFSGLVRRAIADYIRSQVDARLKGALETRRADRVDEGVDDASEADAIVTTETEVDGFKVVRAIASEVVDPERIVMRDNRGYCAVLFDNNNRKPIVRLHFNNENRLRVQIFDTDNPPRVSIDKVPDMYQHREAILRAVRQYIADGQAQSAETEIEDKVVTPSAMPYLTDSTS